MQFPEFSLRTAILLLDAACQGRVGTSQLCLYKKSELQSYASSQ